MLGSMTERLRSLREEWRPSAVTAGAPVFPLAVLFGLNAVDELDRTAFGILLPEIRDHFGLSNQAALTLVAVSAVADLLVQIPLAHLADRYRRTRIALWGAVTWACFSVGTGLAVATWMLAVARIGAGTGRAVVTPTHNSLLSDYYPSEARVKVFGVHRLANSVGQIAGPLVAGIVAYFLGFRAPFILLAVPTLVLVVLATRLPEPVRGLHERREAGADDTLAGTEEDPVSLREAVRLLVAVPTMRRILCAVPFLGVALFGVSSLLALIYEDIFGLNEIERGVVAAAVEPAQIVAIGLFIPFASKLLARSPALLVRYVAVVGVATGAVLGGLSQAPNVGLAIAFHVLVSLSVGTLAPAIFALLSLIMPPKVRSVGFSVLGVTAVPGVLIMLPIIGRVADSYGLRTAMLLMIPVSMAAGLIIASAHRFVEDDVRRVREQSVAGVRDRQLPDLDPF